MMDVALRKRSRGFVPIDRGAYQVSVTAMCRATHSRQSLFGWVDIHIAGSRSIPNVFQQSVYI
jgi:hypothetical protein